ncbi:DedA family protein [Sphingomonas histidinilytica]|jgi:membrane protein DedA with SNARE-associated domain|uniref:Membrane protein DedA, SNARE-associated domain n=1 Tax=Rhizorhabdus histidinilytica TaxID=439228 RepID=A0A1T5F589_9SPHN|nr:DedA family protein [Rhizorhabdus histidinilytica]MBO9379581.1 DedA family protein [Rhizorhabdus histidinilytica]QEH78000.1 DedA family protein [Sphingomonas sp. C8-2]SKB91377.1 membrane protein DedA, SNARE-associated domain [Rhizorhabdus histidinilytica]
MTDWVQQLIADGGYLGLFLLMFGETIFPPIPSEVIMSMAGLQAAKGSMLLPVAIAAGSAGAMLGNIAWYLAARRLGLDRLRPLVERHGRWLTMDWAEVDRGERWFMRHGYLFVCLGRMLPTARSLISVPAGLMRMRFVPFVLWSSVGTFGWSTMLAVGGWILGTRFAAMEAWLGIASTLLLVVLAAFYLWRVLTWKPSR